MKAFDLGSIVNNFYREILEDKDKSNWEAYILVLAPAVLAQVAMFRHIDANFIGTTSTALAILFGFTFSSLLATAEYTPNNDPNEEQVVKETRLATSYALLINFTTLVSVILVSIVVVDYASMGYTEGTALSAGVYYMLFHYLIVMGYLLRYIYLLTQGGAFEESEQSNRQPPEVKEDEGEVIEITKTG